MSVPSVKEYKDYLKAINPMFFLQPFLSMVGSAQHELAKWFVVILI